MFNLFVFFIFLPAGISVFTHILFKIRYPSIFVTIKVQGTITLVLFIYFIIIRYYGFWVSDI